MEKDKKEEKRRGEGKGGANTSTYNALVFAMCTNCTNPCMCCKVRGGMVFVLLSYPLSYFLQWQLSLNLELDVWG